MHSIKEVPTTSISNCAASTRPPGRHVRCGDGWGISANWQPHSSRRRHSTARAMVCTSRPVCGKAKQGKAEAAALVPALWVDIDCDGDAHQRDQNLTRLRDFDPAPSFILDSGGGWHGYWLLDEPFQLQSDADRQKIAGILRGSVRRTRRRPGIRENCRGDHAPARFGEYQTRTRRCCGQCGRELPGTALSAGLPLPGWRASHSNRALMG